MQRDSEQRSYSENSTCIFMKRSILEIFGEYLIIILSSAKCQMIHYQHFRNLYIRPFF